MKRERLLCMEEMYEIYGLEELTEEDFYYLFEENDSVFLEAFTKHLKGLIFCLASLIKKRLSCE